MYSEQRRAWNDALDNALKGIPGVTEEQRKATLEKANQDTAINEKGRDFFNASIAEVLLPSTGSSSSSVGKRPADVTVEELSGDQQAAADASRAEAARVREAAEAKARSQHIA